MSQTTAVDARSQAGEPHRPVHLSPSRAANFMQCPLLYRFKVVDKLPDPASLATVRGVVVHDVLETLFAQPPETRTLEKALSLLPQSWTTVCRERPDHAELLNQIGVDTVSLLAQCEQLLQVYFAIENPSLYHSTQQEVRLDVSTENVPMLGFIDRIDTAPNGWERITDYKTGKQPPSRFRDRPLWQLRFYALGRFLETGTVPRQLRLIYLGNGGGTIVHEPDRSELEQFQGDVEDVWATIQTAFDHDDWEPRPSKLCGWCPFRSRCPAQNDRA